MNRKNRWWVALAAMILWSSALVAEIQPGYGILDVDDIVYATGTFDDGSGERLYASGSFRVAGDVRAELIASWDGTRWSSLPGVNGANGVSATALAFATFDDGQGSALYVGGGFTTAGGVTANRIARWDGSAWAPLAGGLNGTVYAMAVFDDGTGPALYVGGFFSQADGIAARRIARWDGAAWSAVGNETDIVDGRVLAMAVHDDGSGPALYIAGMAVSIGDLQVNGIARWDGTSWSALEGPSGTGVEATSVEALASFDGGDGADLYVGGSLTAAGGKPVFRIARWDGEDWFGLPETADKPGGTVMTFEIFDFGDGPHLAVGSVLAGADPATTRVLTTWDGAEWSGIISGEPAIERVFTLSAFNGPEGPALIVGGRFIGNSLHEVVNYIGQIDEGVVVPLSSETGQGALNLVKDLAVFDPGTGPEIYAAGPVSVGDVWTRRLARKVEGQWTDVVDINGFRPESIFLSVEHLVASEATGELYTAGARLANDETGDVTGSTVLAWDGVLWRSLPSLGLVDALEVFDDGGGPLLYGAGNISDGVDTYQLARVEGSTRTLLLRSNQVAGTIDMLRAIGPYLYVGGDFTGIAGVTADGLARWDGQSWFGFRGLQGEGGGPAAVYDVELFDDGTGPVLYATGDFVTGGGATVNGVARWDEANQRWQPAGSGLLAMDQTVAQGFVLRSFESNGVPRLFVGGRSFGPGGASIPFAARWNGLSWSLLGDGTFARRGSVTALQPIPGEQPSLLLGGDFDAIGGVTSVSLAEWRFNPEIFSDGFESGDTVAWSSTRP